MSNLILFIGSKIYVVIVFIFVIEHLCCFIKFVKSSVILIVCTYADRETRNRVDGGHLIEKLGKSHEFSKLGKIWGNPNNIIQLGIKKTKETLTTRRGTK